jgi:acid-sensing ion channel, other
MFGYVKNYCSETTLHGFRYITQPTCRRSEKIFWLLSLIFSFACAILLIHNVVKETKKTPIITVTSNSLVPIGDIPFPAVTLCEEFRFEETDIRYKLLTYYYIYPDRDYFDSP